MAKIIYSELDNESLLVESKNLTNEIRAFMDHNIISDRKINEFSTKIDEISKEVNTRVFETADEEMFLRLLAISANLDDMLNKLKISKESRMQPQPQ